MWDTVQSTTMVLSHDMPCPHCGHMDYIRWEHIRWPTGRPEEARLFCHGEDCGAEIEEHHKTWMLDRGEWRATAVSKRPRTRGYHLPGLYSPIGWRSGSADLGVTHRRR